MKTLKLGRLWLSYDGIWHFSFGRQACGCLVWCIGPLMVEWFPKQGCAWGVK